MHAATFGIETGEMLSGPVCPDRWLVRVPVTVEDGRIRLARDGLPRYG